MARMTILLLQRAARGGSRTTTRPLSKLWHLGAAGLFILAIIDSSPLPTFGGPDILTAILSATHRGPWYEFAIVSTAGSVIGAYLTFRVARKAGGAYLEKKFKKSGKGDAIRRIFDHYGTGVLFASAAVPLPTPTGILFAAAGASEYPPAKFVGIVTGARAIRYSAIAIVADIYGRHFVRVLRHPSQYWGWLTLFIVLAVGLTVTAFLINRHLAAATN
jgi:membrane protein YqaA with SNARE-associated domain